MAILRVLITESWPGSKGREPLAWVLRDAKGAILSRGNAAASELPRARRLELVAPAAAVLLLTAKLPVHRGAKARRLLPFTVEDKLADEPETVHVAMGSARADGTAIAVVNKAWLRSVLALLEGAGRKPQRMVVETLLPALEPGAWTVAWKQGEGFLRSGPCTGQVLDRGSGDAVPMALAAALKEAREAPRQVVVRPVPGTAPPDCAGWSEALGLPVVVGPPWDWREADLAEAPLDLLQGEFAPPGLPEVLPRLKPALLVGALIVTVLLGAVGADWWFLKRERQALQKEMEANFRLAFPDAAVVVDPALQMERELAALRRAASAATPGDFLPLLARTAPLLEAQGGNRLKGLRYEGGTLKVDLTTGGSEAVEGLRRRLRDAGFHANVAAGSPGAEGTSAQVTLTAE